MKNRWYLSLIGSIFLIFSNYLEGAELKGIDFQQRNDISFLEFLFDTDNVQSTKFHVKADKQIIVDFKNIKAAARVLRSFDTSEFSGPVVFVSAYPKPQNAKDIRVVLQLRDNVNSTLERQKNKTVLMIENRFGVFAQMEQKPGDLLVGDGQKALKINIPKSNSLEDILENLTLSGAKKYVGKKISLNVQNLSIEDMLKMIAEISGFNIILTESAKGASPITLTINDIPWDQALDTILELSDLSADRRKSILIIYNTQVLTQKRKIEEEEKKKLEDQRPLETRVIPISYAKIEDLEKILRPYLTKDVGKITSDKRTNSLIIEDALEVIERTKKIITILDTQTPQILIESKIIDIDQSYRKELGLNSGFNFSSNLSPGRTSVRTGPVFNFSSVGELSAGDNVSIGTAMGFAMGLGQMATLNFRLQLYESEGKTKTIASPKIITQNNKAATITSSDQEPYRILMVSEGSSQTGYENAEASTNMTVTPQVTNEGAINMEINISRSTFGERGSDDQPPPTATRTVNTNVLVDNGSTVVIGGLYNSTESNNEAGIPFLKDIPLVGWLFRKPSIVAENKTEMMIFLTPRIINEEESGLIESEIPENPAS